MFSGLPIAHCLTGTANHSEVSLSPGSGSSNRLMSFHCRCSHQYTVRSSASNTIDTSVGQTVWAASFRMLKQSSASKSSSVLARTDPVFHIQNVQIPPDDRLFLIYNDACAHYLFPSFSMISCILLSKNSAGIRAIPTSSLATIRRSPPLIPR